MVVAGPAASALANPVRLSDQPDGRPFDRANNRPAGRTITVIAHAEVTDAERGILPRPVSLAPDVYLRVVDRVTLGVVHSHRALGLVDAGGGLCLSDCDERYRNPGIDVLYDIRRQLGARVRLVARELDPIELQLHLGLDWHWQRGRLGVHAAPYLAFGLSNRDLGNDDFINLPLWLTVRVGAGVSGVFHTGIAGQIDSFGDTYEIPVGLGVRYRRGPYLAGVQYAFARLFGRLNAILPRHLVVSFGWQR